EGDEAPEHEQVCEADERLVAEDPALEHDIEDPRRRAIAEVVEAEVVLRAREQAIAHRHLLREPADKEQDEEAEDPGLDHQRFNSLMMAGTISNRSPTMP